MRGLYKTLFVVVLFLSFSSIKASQFSKSLNQLDFSSEQQKNRIMILIRDNEGIDYQNKLLFLYFYANLEKQESPMLVSANIFFEYLSRARDQKKLVDNWNVYHKKDNHFYLFIPRNSAGALTKREKIRFSLGRIENVSSFKVDSQDAVIEDGKQRSLINRQANLISIKKGFAQYFFNIEDVKKNVNIGCESAYLDDFFNKNETLSYSALRYLQTLLPLWNIYIVGHGSSGKEIGGLDLKEFDELLNFFNGCNTHFMFLLSCHSAGKNRISITDKAENSFANLNYMVGIAGIQEEIVQKMYTDTGDFQGLSTKEFFDIVEQKKGPDWLFNALDSFAHGWDDKGINFFSHWYSPDSGLIHLALPKKLKDYKFDLRKEAFKRVYVLGVVEDKKQQLISELQFVKKGPLSKILQTKKVNENIFLSAKDYDYILLNTPVIESRLCLQSEKSRVLPIFVLVNYKTKKTSKEKEKKKVKNLEYFLNELTFDCGKAKENRVGLIGGIVQLFGIAHSRMDKLHIYINKISGRNDFVAVNNFIARSGDKTGFAIINELLEIIGKDFTKEISLEGVEITPYSIAVETGVFKGRIEIKFQIKDFVYTLKGFLGLSGTNVLEQLKGKEERQRIAAESLEWTIEKKKLERK